MCQGLLRGKGRRWRREGGAHRQVDARVGVCGHGHVEAEGRVRLEEQVAQGRVELWRALVHQQLLRRRLLGQLRQRREEVRQAAHVRRLARGGLALREAVGAGRGLQAKWVAGAVVHGERRKRGGIGGRGARGVQAAGEEGRLLTCGRGLDPGEEAERRGVLAVAGELLAVLDVVERDAAVRVPRRELLAVGAPGEAADGLLIHTDHEEALPRHAVHQDLQVGGDERDQVHGGTPLHGEHIAAAALGEALEDLKGRHCAPRGEEGARWPRARRGSSA